MSAHTAETTNTNVSEAFVWTCEIEMGKFCIQHVSSTAIEALGQGKEHGVQHFEESPLISTKPVSPKDSKPGDILLLVWVKLNEHIIMFDLSTWNPAGRDWMGVPGSRVIVPGNYWYRTDNSPGDLCPNLQSFRTTPGEFTQKHSSTRTGFLCLRGEFYQFSLPCREGLG